MRLHSSIRCFDYRRTTRFRQGIDFSRIHVRFADHVHRRAGVHNKPSFLRFKSWCRQATYFPKVRRMLLFVNFNTRLASFHAASRAHRSCHSVSSWDRASNFGALGLRSWGSPGQMYPSEGFWSRILVWRAIAFVNFTRWIGLCMFVLFRRIDFGGFMSWNTQPNCRASENWRFDEFRPNFLPRLWSGFPERSWYRSVTDSRSCQLPFFNNTAEVLYSAHCPFGNTISLRSVVV